MNNSGDILPLKPMDRESISTAVMELITDYLLSGRLKPGDKLPTENEFAQNLGVGKNSIREAIKMLTSIGVVEIKRGLGMFITESMSSSMINPIILSLVFEQGTSMELIELRLLLDTDAAELVMQKGSKQAIKKLEEANQSLCEEAKKQNHNPHQLRDLDLNFHRVLYEVCGNTLLAKIGRAIYTLFFASIEKSVKVDPQLAYQNHEMVIDAIKQRDAELVRRRTRESLSFWMDSLRKERDSDSTD